MGKKSRSKGQRGEREVRDLVREYGYWAERGRSQSAGGGAEDPDVRTDIPGVHLEVKLGSMVPVTCYKFMAQAREDAGGERVPVVFARRDREPWLVILDARDWIERERAR